MRRSMGLALAVAVGCKGVAAKPRDAAVRPATPGASEAAPSAAALDATTAAPAFDAGGPAPDAAARAATADAPGATFFLVDSNAPLDGVLVLGELTLAESAAVTGPGEIVLSEAAGDSLYVAARPLATVPARYQALVGTRIELHDERGPVCQATIGRPLAVRQGTVYADAGVTMSKALRPLPAEPMWGERAGVDVWASYASAPLVDPTGDCDAARFAVAPGRKLPRSRVSAAKDWEAIAADRFLASDRARMQSEKVALEGESAGAAPRFTSVRRVGPATGPSFAILYGVARTRALAVFRVPGADLAAGEEVTTVLAETPSTVTGLDADGDGALDLLIGHPDGVALIPGHGGPEIMLGGLRNLP